jgi:hypothetical protein
MARSRVSFSSQHDGDGAEHRHQEAAVRERKVVRRHDVLQHRHVSEQTDI